MALKLIKVTPKKALNKAYLKVRPLRSEIDLFKANLITLLSKVNEVEREENQKNHIRDFLRDTYYKGINEINTKGTQDLVIHVDKTDQSKVGVIIEAKRPSNKSEWITADKINVKAVQELVLYYMRERVDEKNIDIKYLIATNIHEWYIFDAGYFDKVFYGNKKFVKQYEEWRDGKKVTKDTALFYNDIAKPFIDALEDEIPATYFDIRDYDKELRNEDKTDDKKLIALQKLLSAHHLLRVPFANDSNELNNRFYKELLHIIGLEEVKDGGKQIIRRKSKDASEGSMIENTINILKTEDILVRLKNKQIYGETKDEQLYNIALELNLTWINRILFLKLLEGQLLSYHRNNKRYNFLNKDVVFDYDEIYKLFHQVLAKTMLDRTGNIVQKYQWVPYLNSSLFEISELENQTIKINSLDDHAHLEVMNGSILGQYKNQSINPLQYLFEFLDAYDFASEGVEEVQEDNRTLINASILGKIFEKINGYKDGSIYTPGFITMYMCRQAIRRAVVQKFKDAYGWNIHEFGDIRNYITDRRSKADILEFNALINSLRLCDPAVGSGHFLVSALNEMVLIKYELGLLCDNEGSRITDYDLTIENDELIVTYSNGDIFEYQIIDGKPKSKEDQRLQKSLFHEKQTIIENCLFGVDINPNSVKICRLRLWIELLKNAYYKEESGYTELETLPNIDINIKCGNSLISRFGLDSDLGIALKSIKYDIKTYRGFVQDYKNCKDREAKRGIEDIIIAIKNDFRSEIGKKDKDVLKLNALSGELFNLVNQQSLFENEKEKKAKELKVKKLEEDINTLIAKIEEIKSNAIYRDAFEWRFEFPEVLDDDGNFVGFDVVVGNPPYMRVQEIEKSQPLQKKVYETKFRVAKGSYDLANLFFEMAVNLSHEKSSNAYIFPHKFLNADSSIEFRRYLIEGKYIDKLAHFGANMIFENADTYTCIAFFSKEDNQGIYFQRFGFKSNYQELIFDESEFSLLSYESIYKASELYGNNSWILFDNEEGFNIFEKIYRQKSSIKGKFDKVFQGIATGKDELYLIEGSEKEEFIEGYFKGKPNLVKIEKGITKPFLKGKNVHRYSSLPNGSFILFPYVIDENGKANIMNEKYIEKNFPSAYKWLKETENLHRTKDNKSTDDQYWYRYARSQGINNVEIPKLSSMEICSTHPNVAYNFMNYYHPTTVYSWVKKQDVVEDYQYFLAIANSSLIWWFLINTGDTLQGDARRFKTNYLNPFPLPEHPDELLHDKLVSLVNIVIENKKQNHDTTNLETEIDRLVYELYGLTEDEIKIIENG